MFKKKEPDFTYFNEEWNRNEPTTDEDYLEDGVNDYISIPTKSEAYED
jgi:hypothetical protein